MFLLLSYTGEAKCAQICIRAAYMYLYTYMFVYLLYGKVNNNNERASYV